MVNIVRWKTPVFGIIKLPEYEKTNYNLIYYELIFEE